jgi:hypothetical protein
MKNKNNKGQMEMSVGTIVTIVLLVTLLILGVVLIKNIFNVSTGVVDLTDQQLRTEINKLFSEDSKISIYPGTRLLEMKQETTAGIGIGIKNLLTGASSDKTFSYNVVVSDSDIETKCGIKANVAESWMVTGRSEENIPIPSGDFTTQKILFEIPSGSSLCTIRFRVNVNTNDGKIYATDFFDLKVKAK